MPVLSDGSGCTEFSHLPRTRDPQNWFDWSKHPLLSSFGAANVVFGEQQSLSLIRSYQRGFLSWFFLQALFICGARESSFWFFHVLCHFNLWREHDGRGLAGNGGSATQVARFPPTVSSRLTVTTSPPRSSVLWVSGHPFPVCFHLSCGASNMQEWVNVAASCAPGTGMRPARFTPNGRWHGMLRRRVRNFDERCIDTGVFQNRCLLHKLVFACSTSPPLRPHISIAILTQNRLVRLEEQSPSARRLCFLLPGL